MFGSVNARSALKSSASWKIASGFGATLLLALPTAALANPTGASVSSGSATVSTPSSNKTVVNQSSQGVVINWKSFDINKNEVTQFIQPNAKSVAINRIGSQNASQILGTLSANGRVVLINPNGIAFGKGSKVNVGALIATTTDGTDNDLLAGKFTKAGSAAGYVTNAGRINANGTVALVAPNVSNSGVVNAKIGSVSLGGTNKFTVDFNGDGLVSFAAGDASKASVSNTGRLTGVNVSMTARTAEGLATGVVSTGGIVTATGANGIGGNITIDAGNGGKISVTGAKIVASGKNGGGNVTIGGWNHSSVTVDKKSSIDTSATLKGNGGNVSVIAASTVIKGTIDARGGKQSGNGGQIETSGHTVDFGGAKVTAGAAHGEGGSWSVDPVGDLIIDASEAATINTALQSNTDFNIFNTGGANSGGTVVAGVGDIDIESALTWGTTATLTIDALHSVNVYAPISVTGGGTLGIFTNDGTASTDPFTNYTNNAGDGVFLATAPVTFSDLADTPTLDINGDAYTLVDTFADLVTAVDGVGGARVAIASDLDASGGAPYTNFAIDNVAFTGVLEGLGNSISGIDTVADGSSTTVGGLVGTNNGRITNVHLVAPSVSGSSNNGEMGGLVALNAGTLIGDAVIGGSVSDGAQATVGGLVGLNQGVIRYSSSTASVSGALASFVGGLAGLDQVSISNSFATGAVSTGDNGIAGGFVGVTFGTDSDDFAMGNVSGGALSSIGGFVGEAVSASISTSFATGDVLNSPVPTAGFVADNITSTFTDDYWDTDTSGQTGDDGNAGTTGLTTAGLQGSLPTGFGTSSWTTGTGLYPYLTWMSPLGTPDVVSGISYSDRGTTASANTGYGLAIDGANPTPLAAFSATGANGYYYALLSSGTIAGSDVAVYATGTPHAVTYAPGGVATALSLDLYGGWTRYISDAATSSAMASGYASAVGALSLTAGPNLEIDASAATFDIDAALAPAGANGRLLIDSDNDVTESTGSITAKRLVLTGTGDFALDGSSNAITGLSADVGSLILVNTTGLLITSISGVDGAAAETGGLSITAGGDIQINNNVSGLDSVSLNTTGRIVEGGTAGIDTAVFNGSSTGGAVLNGDNSIAEMQDFINTGGGGVSLNNDGGLQLDSTFSLDAGTGSLTLTVGGPLNILGSISAGNIVDLEVTGAITEFDGASYTGTITATTLTGSSDGGADFSGTNDITQISGFTNANAGGFRFNNGANALRVSGAIDSGDNQLDLTSGNLQINANLTTGGKLDLFSSGQINEMTGVVMTADLLSGSSTGGASLNGSNQIAKLGAFTNTGAGGFSLADGQTLKVNGALAGGSGNVSLNGTGDILINKGITTSAKVALTSGGRIIEGNSGSITAAQLSGTSNGAVRLGGDNQVANLYTFDTSGNDFTLANNNSSLKVSGFVNAGSGKLTLSSGFGDINLAAAIAGGKVSLTAGGQVIETGSGAITASLLTGLSTGRTLLNGSANHIGRIQDYQAGGNFTLADNDALLILGSLTSSNGNVSLTDSNSLRINGSISGSDVTLNGTSVTELDFGQISAATVHGTATSGFELYGPNTIGKITGITNSTGIVEVTTLGNLTVSGAINAGGSHVIIAGGLIAGDLTLDSTITTTGTTDLYAFGNITETGNGQIVAGTLSLTGFDVNLGSSNQVGILNGASVTDLTFVDGTGLTIKGFVGSCGCSPGDISIVTTTGNINLLGTLSGDSVYLNAVAGQIVEGGQGSVTANKLSGNAAGQAKFSSSFNDVVQLTGFTSNGFTLVDGGTLNVTGALNAGTGNIGLTTTSGNLQLNAAVTTAGRIALNSAGTIVEGANGKITATTLTGSSAGSTTLNNTANLIAKLDDFTAVGFSLYDNEGLDVIGDVVSTPNHPLTLTVNNGNLRILGTLSARTVNLTANTGSVFETSTGGVFTHLLNVSASTGIQLASLNNNITLVGTDTTTTGPNTIDKGPHI